MTLTKKAYDVVVMDLRKLSSVADFFVVCSADSDVQVRAIAEAVEEGMERRGVSLWQRETESPHWMVLDYVDVVLHIFHKTTRTFYSLEKLWGDAAIKHLTEDAKRAAARVSRTTRSRPKKVAPKRKAS